MNKDASAEEIKKAYRKLARANHPDSNPGDTAKHDKFKAVAEAYDVVGDAEKRTQYDEIRSMPDGWLRPGGPGGGGGLRHQRPAARPGGGGGGGFGDMFGDLFGGGAAQRRAAAAEGRRRRDHRDRSASPTPSTASRSRLRLTSDAPCPDCSGTGGKPGTKPHICPECEGAGMVASTVGGAFTINETCPACGGRQLLYDEPCPTCHGTGRGMSARSIQARIPAGVKDGQRIRLRGKGAHGENGGPAGDLYVTVKVSPHRLFGRKGDNLTLEVPVSFDEAALGAEIKVPTLSGCAGHPQDPRGHAQRAHLPGPRQGRPQVRRHHRRPAGHRRGAGARGARPGRPRGGRGLPRRHRRASRCAATCSREPDVVARPGGPQMPGPDVAVYVISVAAELTGLHPQTLRTYERLGLILPGRTGGGGRRYSHRDVELLREIADLTATASASRGSAGSSTSRTGSPPSQPATRSWWPSSRRPARRCARR